MSRLSQHLAAIEGVLIAQGMKLRPVQNTTIVGTAREIFVRDFLKSHLGSATGIGSGEIISAFKPTNQIDRQQDVVVYDSRYPRLSLSDGLDSFLIESVHCTIEVKTTLTEDEYIKSARAAAELKHRWGMQKEALYRQAPRRFVVAFDGPVKMTTVLGWMKTAYESNQLQSPEMPVAEMYFEGPDELIRSQHVSSSLDGIFVLGRGFILMDSFGFRFQGAVDEPPGRNNGRHFHYACADSSSGSLACLFMALMHLLDRAKLTHEYMPAIDAAQVTFHKMPHPKAL